MVVRGELERLADIAAAHDGWILADEIHSPLALPGAEHIPFITVSDAAAARGICLVSASKAFNLAGLITPGAYLTIGVAGSPFSLGLGASVSPFAHALRNTERDTSGDIEAVNREYLPAVRVGAFLAVDITFISFGLR